MNLEQFKELNVLGLPVIAESDARSSDKDNADRILPSHFFLHGKHHLVYAVQQQDGYKVYDSLGAGQSSFRTFFMLRSGKFATPGFYTTRQTHPTSTTCALHAVLASLGYQVKLFNHFNADYWLEMSLLPLLKRLTKRVAGMKRQARLAGVREELAKDGRLLRLNPVPPEARNVYYIE